MWRADGDDAGTKLNADGDVVMRREAAFAEADGQARLAASRVADADELGDVVPGSGRHGRRERGEERKGEEGRGEIEALG